MRARVGDPAVINACAYKCVHARMWVSMCLFKCTSFIANTAFKGCNVPFLYECTMRLRMILCASRGVRVRFPVEFLFCHNKLTCDCGGIRIMRAWNRGPVISYACLYVYAHVCVHMWACTSGMGAACVPCVFVHDNEGV